MIKTAAAAATARVDLQHCYSRLRPTLLQHVVELECGVGDMLALAFMHGFMMAIEQVSAVVCCLACWRVGALPYTCNRQPCGRAWHAMSIWGGSFAPGMDGHVIPRTCTRGFCSAWICTTVWVCTFAACAFARRLHLPSPNRSRPCPCAGAGRGASAAGGERAAARQPAQLAAGLGRH